MKSLVISTLSAPASLFDDVERAQDDAFGLLDAGAGGSAQPDAQQSERSASGKDLGAHARQQHDTASTTDAAR